MSNQNAKSLRSSEKPALRDERTNKQGKHRGLRFAQPRASRGAAANNRSCCLYIASFRFHPVCSNLFHTCSNVEHPGNKFVLNGARSWNVLKVGVVLWHKNVLKVGVILWSNNVLKVNVVLHINSSCINMYLKMLFKEYHFGTIWGENVGI